MVRLVKVGKAVKPVRVRCWRDLVHFTGLLRVRCGWDLVHFTGLLRVRCGQGLVHFRPCVYDKVLISASLCWLSLYNI
jgi:hypothetical protein